MKPTKSSTLFALATAGLLPVAITVASVAAASTSHVLPPTACQLRAGAQDNLAFVSNGLKFVVHHGVFVRDSTPVAFK